jgi:tRNA dimethylallyltransferase
MERLIAIIGPTAVGKTKVSIDLALKLDTEIISGDSMLVYKGLDVGTAKPDMVEQQGIKHHLIDILEPDDEFSVVIFQEKAADIVSAINHKDRIPILAGGTGLYVRALLEGYKFSQVSGNEELRDKYSKLAETHGSTYLHELLAKVSPSTAGRLHPNDTRRIIRALEVHHIGGETVSTTKEPSVLYEALVIGLTMPRDKLYDQINRRVDLMMANGLVDEVRRLLAAGVSANAQAMQGIGYKEIISYLQGDSDLPTAVSRIKQATRHFAKRQLTWYRKMPYIEWVEVDKFDNYNKMMAHIYSKVAGKFNLG